MTTKILYIILHAVNIHDYSRSQVSYLFLFAIVGTIVVLNKFYYDIY